MISLMDYYSICNWWRDNKKPEIHLGRNSIHPYIKYFSLSSGELLIFNDQQHFNQGLLGYHYNGKNDYCTAYGDVFYIGGIDNNNKIVKFLNEIHSIEVGDLESLNEICLQHSFDQNLCLMLSFWGGILRVKDYNNIYMDQYLQYKFDYEWLWSEPIWARGPSDKDIFYGKGKNAMVGYGPSHEIKKECLYSTWKELQAFK